MIPRIITSSTVFQSIGFSRHESELLVGTFSGSRSLQGKGLTFGTFCWFPEDHEKAIREPQRGPSGQILC